MSNQSSGVAVKSDACYASLDELLSQRLFKALADPNRLALLVRLATCGESCTVGQLADCLTVDVSVVSRHLAILRDAGVLAAEKQGKQVYYSVQYRPVVETLRAIADAIDACCEEQGCCQPAAAKKSARAKSHTSDSSPSPERNDHERPKRQRRRQRALRSRRAKHAQQP